MKGFRTYIEVGAYTLQGAEMNYTTNGKAVTSFPVAVGGNREKGIRGKVFRCRVWSPNAETVIDKINRAGQAVVVKGRIEERTKESGGKTYVNTNINVDYLEYEAEKGDTHLKLFPMVDGFNKDGADKSTLPEEQDKETTVESDKVKK